MGSSPGRDDENEPIDDRAYSLDTVSHRTDEPHRRARFAVDAHCGPLGDSARSVGDGRGDDNNRQGKAALAGFGGVTVIVVGCNVATIATM